MDPRGTPDLSKLEQSQLRLADQLRRIVEYRFGPWTLISVVLIAVIAVKLLTSR